MKNGDYWTWTEEDMERAFRQGQRGEGCTGTYKPFEEFIEEMKADKEGVMIDHETLLYVRHLIAGNLSNLIGLSDFIRRGDNIDKYLSILDENSKSILSKLDNAIQLTK